MNFPHICAFKSSIWIEIFHFIIVFQSVHNGGALSDEGNNKLVSLVIIVVHFFKEILGENKILHEIKKTKQNNTHKKKKNK